MIRDLNYSIRFATVNEFALVHEMTLDEDHAKELHETFSIEGTGVHGAHFTLAQFALLHRAIHEMLRMHDQHVDALTDGAEQPDPAPDEAAPVLTAEELRLLTAMQTGEELHYNVDLSRPWMGKGSESDDVPWDVFGALLKARFLDVARPAENRIAYYTISDKGRAVIAAQEPDEAEANGLTEAATAYLLMLAATDATIEMGHPGFGVMFNSGFLKVTDESAGRPTMIREYSISEKGRAVLAAQGHDDD